MRKALYAPVSVDLSITEACNLRCVYCYAEATPLKVEYIERSQLLKLFQKFSDLGVHFVRLAGGEPLLHPEISGILEDISKFPFQYSISTNGLLLTKEKIEILQKTEFPWIVISLDGSSEETHSLTRGEGHWNKVITSIRNLKEAGLRVTTASVLTSKNAHDVQNLLDTIESLGLDRAAFLMFCPVGRGSNCLNNLTLNKSQLSEIIHTLTKWKDSKNQLEAVFVPSHESHIPWEVSHFIDEQSLSSIWKYVTPSFFKRTVSCMGGISTCSITATGDVYPCEQFMAFPEMVAGNIYDNDFIDIWNNGDSFQKLRNIEFIDLDEKCINCESIGCGGGCRAVGYASTNEIVGLDDRCNFYE